MRGIAAKALAPSATDVLRKVLVGFWLVGISQRADPEVIFDHRF